MNLTIPNTLINLNTAMKKISIITLLAACVVFVATSCDEGDIKEAELTGNNEGRMAKLTANLTGMDTWSSQYSLVLAGFNSDSEYAVLQKPVPEGSKGDVTMTMKLAQGDIETIELCITNRLRQRITTFASVDVNSQSGDTLRINAGTVDVSMFNTIQDMVFTVTCARCHGLGNSPAAGLSLAKGESYANLVNHVAKNPDNGMRVVPGDAESSLLHKVIHGDANSGVPFDHSNMIKENTTITLIDNWIKSLVQ